MKELTALSYDEAAQAILTAPRFKEIPSIENVKKYLGYFGHPEKNFHIIHVAGTNGKGSTCAFLERILRGRGIKTGLFTSPHLITVRERMQINGGMVGKESFTHAFLRIKKAEKDSGFPPLTFFEFILVMALFIFREENVEYAVIEAGMGGRSDATCALMPKLCIITAVGMDHMRYLGNTIQEIAKEKAGIMKPGIPCIFVDHGPETGDIFREEAAKTGCPLCPIPEESFKILKNSGKVIDFLVENRYYRDSVLSVRSCANYQAENACAAATAAKLLFPDISIEQVKDGLMGTFWPGRMEEVRSGVIVDGAHNEPSIRAFMDTVRSDGRQAADRILVFAVAADKDYTSMAREIFKEENFRAVILTGIPYERMEDPSKVKSVFDAYANVPVYVKKPMEEAYNFALSMKQRDGAVYLTGSLYFVGSLKKFLKGDECDDRF